jgi:hypothetical protein
MLNYTVMPEPVDTKSALIVLIWIYFVLPTFTVLNVNTASKNNFDS